MGQFGRYNAGNDTVKQRLLDRAGGETPHDTSLDEGERDEDRNGGYHGDTEQVLPVDLVRAPERVA
jgi:hypothetical protein